MKDRLGDKVIIVTGGSRGIGKACALRCAQAGAAVVVDFLSDSRAAADTVAEIQDLGARAIAVRADVACREDVEALVSTAVDHFGYLSGLLNNAGVALFADFLEMEDKDWDRIMAVNVKGVYLVSQAVARQMVKQGRGGRICNVSSISGVKATDALQLAYCASKGAANMFTKAAAVALARYNITVNAILPGTIETDINRRILADPEVRRRIETATPLGCLGEADDIGYAAVYLLSDESRWITGALLAVDGGFIA